MSFTLFLIKNAQQESPIYIEILKKDTITSKPHISTYADEVKSFSYLDILSALKELRFNVSCFTEYSQLSISPQAETECPTAIFV